MRLLTQAIVKIGNVYRRVLAFGLHLVGPRATYAFYRSMAKWMYRLLEPLRRMTESQCRAALHDRYTQEHIARIARDSFVHRSLNLADLMLADWRINAKTLARYGGRIPAPYFDMLHEAQAAGRAIIFVTAYYGPFDLLPLLLGYNGIRAAAVYKPHANTGFDAYRTRIRTRSGCPAIPMDKAIDQLPEVLENGGAVAILSDHHVPRGVPVSFLGRPTVASRAVGVLALRHGAIVAVAAIRRTDRPFNFEILVADYFDAQNDAGITAADDPVAAVTQRYTAALERIVLTNPAQYLWAHPRWGPDQPTKVDDAESG